MKVRSGFVSNSSTSSFVFLGYKLEYDSDSIDAMKSIISKINPKMLSNLETEGKEEDEILDELREMFYDLRDDSDNQVDFFEGEGCDFMVGALIAYVSSDDGGDDGSEFEIKDLMAKCDNAKKIFGLKGEPKLFTGTICS